MAEAEPVAHRLQAVVADEEDAADLAAPTDSDRSAQMESSPSCW